MASQPSVTCSESREHPGIFGRTGLGGGVPGGALRKSEVEVVRTRITLECTECKNRNYNMTKDKKTHPERMETKKYCKFCRSHTLHKETK